MYYCIIITSDCSRFTEIGCFTKDIINSLSLSPNPFPTERGCVCPKALHLCNRGRLLSVRPAPTLFDHLYASLHRAFGHTRPASLPGLSGAAALTKQGRLQSVAHSRCTMQRHQRLTTRIGATPQTPFCATAAHKNSPDLSSGEFLLIDRGDVYKLSLYLAGAVSHLR